MKRIVIIVDVGALGQSVGWGRKGLWYGKMDQRMKIFRFGENSVGMG